MSVIGNILWFILGGVFMGIGWFLVGLLMYISIIGIPWGRACMVISGFSFFPFGKDVVRRDDLTGVEDIGTSDFGLVGNIIWFLVAGLWLAIGHIIAGFACCVTIIGIPFGIQHFKLAAVSLAPIGKTVVDNEVAAEIRRRKAREKAGM